MAEDFSLNELVRRVISVSDNADPGSLADEVMEQIPGYAVRNALAECLRDFIRIRLPKLHAPISGADLDSVDKPSSRSWKRDALRTWSRETLRDRVHVGPKPTDWKFLGDCTVKDLQFAAQERRTMAASIYAAADRYDKLAAILAEHQATTVQDLDDDTLSEALA